MANIKKEYLKKEDNYLTVEDELVEDFERINFGAKPVSIVEKKLSEANEEMLMNEERKTKVLNKNQKVAGSKVRESYERTAEKQNEKVQKGLSQNIPAHHAPTLRHK
jgi:hypothetical protein